MKTFISLSALLLFSNLKSYAGQSWKIVEVKPIKTGSYYEITFVSEGYEDQVERFRKVRAESDKIYDFSFGNLPKEERDKFHKELEEAERLLHTTTVSQIKTNFIVEYFETHSPHDLVGKTFQTEEDKFPGRTLSELSSQTKVADKSFGGTTENEVLKTAAEQISQMKCPILPQGLRLKLRETFEKLKMDENWRDKFVHMILESKAAGKVAEDIRLLSGPDIPEDFKIRTLATYFKVTSEDNQMYILVSTQLTDSIRCTLPENIGRGNRDLRDIEADERTASFGSVTNE